MLFGCALDVDQTDPLPPSDAGQSDSLMRLQANAVQRLVAFNVTTYCMQQENETGRV
jgi:hypothetical protein